MKVLELFAIVCYMDTWHQLLQRYDFQIREDLKEYKNNIYFKKFRVNLNLKKGWFIQRCRNITSCLIDSYINQCFYFVFTYIFLNLLLPSIIGHFGTYLHICFVQVLIDHHFELFQITNHV